MARKLQHRLALAHFKAKHGWEDLTLDLIEPKVDEQLRRQRPSSSDMLSDSSSSASDFQYARGLLSSSPLKEPIFSDAFGSTSSSSSGHRKRTHNTGFPHATSAAAARKRFRSSPTAGRNSLSNHTAWKDTHQLAQSSPIRPRKQPHFTTSAGPNLSFFRGTSSHMPGDFRPAPFIHGSDEDDELLPMHSFKMDSTDIRSSPPRTPPPVRNRTSFGRRTGGAQAKGKGEEGADLLLFLATSPSPANPTRTRMQPPSTPPPRNPALPSSMMTTPGGGGLLSGFGGPHTPSQNFDFADFVNITPSPAQNAWPKTPGAMRTPLTVARRRLTFDQFGPNGSPGIGSNPSSNSNKHTGLGMQLGGDLIS